MSEQKKVTTNQRKTTTRKPAVNKPATAEPKKKGLLTKVWDSAQKVSIRIRSTRGGRAAIRVTKAAAAGLGLYGAYRIGQKSVRPTVVTITEAVPEEEEVHEDTATATPVEEPADEVQD